MTVSDMWQVRSSTEYFSPLGYSFSYPAAWQIAATGGSAKFLLEDAFFAPLTMLSAQVKENDLSGLQARLIRQIRQDPANQVLETQLLSTPRAAVLIQVLTRQSDLLLRRFYVGELLDEGKLALLFITSDQDRGEDQDYDYLLNIWRQSNVDGTRNIPEYRRMALERWSFTFAFPEHWIVQHVSDALVEIRAPMRSSHQPNIVMEFEENPEQVDLAQFARNTLDFITTELIGVSDIRQIDTQIGNCRGTAFHYKKLNQDQAIDDVRMFLPDPQATPTLTKITLSGLSLRWADYAPFFKKVQQNCYWLFRK